MPDPAWQALYRAALVEPDPIRLNSRIEAARRAIRQRLEQIEDSRDTRERQQLRSVNNWMMRYTPCLLLPQESGLPEFAKFFS